MSTRLEEDFLLAAQANNCFKLKNLLHHGVNIDCVSDNSQTALHVCCFQGHANLVQFLCSSGANTEIQDKEGLYPIHLACSSGHVGTVKELIECGAKLRVYNKSLETPLHFALMKGHATVVGILLAHEEAMVDLPNVFGHTALHLAARHGHLECATLLLRTANVGAQTLYGDTAVHWACQEGHLPITKAILATMDDQLTKENALKLNNKNGKSPRDVAETWRQLEVISWIDSVLTGSDVETPIVYAREDCRAFTDGHLSFSEGDLIAVISKPYKDWWIGRIRGTKEQGLFSTTMVDQWAIDAAAFLDAEVKPIVLEKFRKSNRQLADFMAKIKQQMAKDNWSTLCDSFSKLNLAKKQGILSEQLARGNKHLSHPLLCYILQSQDQHIVLECSQITSPLCSDWEKMSAGSGRLKAFMTRMAVKLAALLIATKVVVSSGCDTDRAFGCSFCCLLGCLYETPGATLLTSEGFKNVQHQNKWQQIDQTIPDSLEELEHIVLKTTECTVDMYEKQIRYLSHKGAETLAECMVLQMMESISLDGLNNVPYTALHKQLARSLVFGRRSAPMAALLRNTAPELADVKYMKQSGLAAHWTAHGILRTTGIRTRDGKYFCGLHSQPGQYGYRNGSRSEAVELCMAIAGEQQSIGPRHKLLNWPTNESSYPYLKTSTENSKYAL